MEGSTTCFQQAWFVTIHENNNNNNKKSKRESWNDGRDMWIWLKIVLVSVIKQLGRVVPNGVKLTQVRAKCEFSYESLKKKKFS